MAVDTIIQEGMSDPLGPLGDGLDQSQLPACVRDLSGRYIAVNRPYADLLGLDGTRLIGKTDNALQPVEVAARTGELDILTREAHGPIDANEVVLARDGRRPVRACRFPLYRDDEPWAICTVLAPDGDIEGGRRVRQSLQTVIGQAPAVHDGTTTAEPAELEAARQALDEERAARAGAERAHREAAEKLAAVQAHTDQLESRSADVNDELERLRSKEAEAKGEVERLRAVHEEALQHNVTLAEERRQIAEELSAARRSQSDLRSELDAATAALATAPTIERPAPTDTPLVAPAGDGQATEAEQLLADTKIDYEEAAARAVIAERQVDSLRSRAAEADNTRAQLAELQSIQRTLKTEFDLLRDKHRRLASEHGELEVRHDALADEYSELKARYDGLTAEAEARAAIEVEARAAAEARATAAEASAEAAKAAAVASSANLLFPKEPSYANERPGERLPSLEVAAEQARQFAIVAPEQDAEPAPGFTPRVLKDFEAHLVQATSTRSAGRAAIASITTALGWDTAAFWTTDDDGIYICSETFTSQVAYMQAWETMAWRTRIEDGLIPTAASTHKPIWSATDGDDVLGCPRARAANWAAMKTIVSVPVAFRGTVIAVLELIARPHLDPQPDTLSMLMKIGGRLAKQLVKLDVPPPTVV